MHCSIRVLAMVLVACAVNSGCNRTPVAPTEKQGVAVVEEQPPAVAPLPASAPALASAPLPASDPPAIQKQPVPGRSAPASEPELEKLDSNSDGPRDFSQVVEAAEAAVIRLNLKTKDSEVTGSGFVVSADGVAFTNYHVVEDAESAVATFRNGATAAVEGTLHVDQQRDIAVIRLKAAGKLDFIQLAPSLPKKGQPVVALGAPRGLSFSVTEGIVSAVRSSAELKELGLDSAGTWIQTSAPISGGNSGGPLVNLQGFVVGANTMSLRTGQNLNFAISADDLRGALEKSQKASLAALGTIKSNRPKQVIRATEPDPSAGESAESIAKRKEFLETITKWNADRLKRIDELKAAIAAEKPSLKEAMLAGDADREKKVRSTIDDLRDQITALAKSLPKLPKLNLMKLSTHDFGFLGGTTVDVIQVIDLAGGRFLVNAGVRSPASPVLMLGNPTLVLISE